MPIYEYRCGTCGRRVSLFYQSIRLAAAGAGAARCPQCGGAHLTRLVSRFNVGRPAERRADPADEPFDPESADYGDTMPPDDPMGGMGALGGVSEQTLAGMDEDDPRTIARWARQMQAETGEDLGPEFNTALGRIEAGEDPDRVMEEMEPGLAGGEEDGGGDDFGDDF
jgi:putative FmdB family regulatory protein